MSDKLGKYKVTEQGDMLQVESEDMSARTVKATEIATIAVNGAWYIDALPSSVVVELADNSLKMFHLTPFREIAKKDLKDYKGYHPRKCKGQPLPEYLYRFYGLVKNEESMTETLRCRVRPSEKSRFMDLANGKSETEFLREIIMEKLQEK